MRNYTRLSIENFGRHLIISGDLDPVYIALWKLRLERAQLSKWLLSYWSFYHAAQACYMSELGEEQFWEVMLHAAVNKPELRPAPIGGRWPRGSERRHFRGDQAVRGVSGLILAMEDSSALFPMMQRARNQNGFMGMLRLVESWPQFGPWIAFKAADMMNTVCNVDCGLSLDDVPLVIYKEPWNGAKLAYEQWQNVTVDRMDANILRGVVTYLLETFKDLRRPPERASALSVLEIETVLCKWKSHLGGHYHRFKDTLELQHSMDARWGETSLRFHAALPTVTDNLIGIGDW